MLHTISVYITKYTCSTIGLKRSQTSTVKMVALLLNAEESDDIRAAIMTAIIRPTIPTGRTFRTSLRSKKDDHRYLSCECFSSIEQYFHVVLFNMLYKVVLTFKSVDETLVCVHSNESLIEQYFNVVLFITLYKVILIFKSVDETLVCDHSYESY